jgi:BlaI family penicillinase repressor
MELVKPTESEWEILQVLWLKDKATVREVHEVLTNNKEIGYTTTLKLMQIMFQKGLVDRDESARSHLYKAKVLQKDAQAYEVGRMITNLFSGSAKNLVMQALGSQQPNAQEIEEIKKYLDQLKSQP